MFQSGVHLVSNRSVIWWPSKQPLPSSGVYVMTPWATNRGEHQLPNFMSQVCQIPNFIWFDVSDNLKCNSSLSLSPLVLGKSHRSILAFKAIFAVTDVLLSYAPIGLSCLAVSLEELC